MTPQQKENAIGFLTRKYGWSRAFCVEYIMERRYHGCSHEEAIEQANEKFREVLQHDPESCESCETLVRHGFPDNEQVY